jgi:calcineurin-like phosphoesterase family protein
MMQKKILFRRESLSKNTWKKTFEIYRNKNDFEVNDDRHSLKLQTYLISDLHLDHENIIRYCARPFSGIDEMNRILVDNWNRIVSPNDTVYFLGDMSYGRDSHSSSFWLKKLNGKIIFIRGNHDRGLEETSDHQILEHDMYRFLLVHDPNKLPIKWDDWIIHGDKQNNNLSSYPFINRKKKTVNVSCEVIGYKPINLEEIIRQINKDSGDQVLVR